MIEFPVTSQAVSLSPTFPQSPPSNQAMFNLLSGLNMESYSTTANQARLQRAQTDCAQVTRPGIVLANNSSGGSPSPGPGPLAALHSMTDMKAAMGLSASPSPPPLPSPCSAGTTTTNPVNPHGIDNILNSRSRSLTLPTTSASMAENLSSMRFGLPNPYLSPGLAQASKLGELTPHQRAALYWPGIQGLISNPSVWRDRFVLNNLHAGHLHDKDGKKKHTRPTFSGQQIFALEKTFEQTKYLAGPERAKLAYALGMTESQVKVWFQNRRTKWRKRHAAEMATAKRRQDGGDNVEGDLGDHSESEDDEEGEAEKTRWKEVQDVEKRVKMEQEMIHQANPALLPDSHSDL